MSKVTCIARHKGKYGMELLRLDDITVILIDMGSCIDVINEIE